MYGAKRAQPVATGRKWLNSKNGSNGPIGNQWQATATVRKAPDTAHTTHQATPWPPRGTPAGSFLRCLTTMAASRTSSGQTTIIQTSVAD